jgi:hypothetical protein
MIATTAEGTTLFVAGGDGRQPLWRHWIERMLWNFEDLPFNKLPKEWTASHRMSLGRLPTRIPLHSAVPSEWPPARRTTYLPPLIEVNAASDVAVHFVSRWVRLTEYPDEIQPALVYRIVRRWGDYEEPPDQANIKRTLRALLRPRSPEAAEREVDSSLDDAADLRDLGETDRRAKAAARRRRSRQSRRLLINSPQPF